MSKLKWRIGEVEFQQIVELEDAGKLIQSTFKEATPENIKKISWLYPHFAPIYIVITLAGIQSLKIIPGFQHFQMQNTFL